MAETAARVALERGVALETVIEVTAGNTRRVLRLPDSSAKG